MPTRPFCQAGTPTDTPVGSPIPVGSLPYGVSVTPDGSKVYVTNSGDNIVSVIDTATNTVAAVLPVGNTPIAFGVFIQPRFAGTPGKANCHGKSISALAHTFGSLKAAAIALGSPRCAHCRLTLKRFARGNPGSAPSRDGEQRPHDKFTDPAPRLEPKYRMMKTVLAACVAIFSSTAAHSEPLPCEPLLLSNTIDRYLDDAWKSARKLFGDPSPPLSAAKVRLSWYYLACTDHNGTWFMKHDLKDFLYTAASLTDNMSAEDAANAKVYQERAVKYQMG